MFSVLVYIIEYSILAQYTLNNNVNWILHYMNRPYMRLFVVFNKVILNEGHSKTIYCVLVHVVFFKQKFCLACPLL